MYVQSIHSIFGRLAAIVFFISASGWGKGLPATIISVRFWAEANVVIKAFKFVSWFPNNPKKFKLALLPNNSVENPSLVIRLEDKESLIEKKKKEKKEIKSKQKKRNEKKWKENKNKNKRKK